MVDGASTVVGGGGGDGGYATNQKAKRCI